MRLRPPIAATATQGGHQPAKAGSELELGGRQRNKRQAEFLEVLAAAAGPEDAREQAALFHDVAKPDTRKAWFALEAGLQATSEEGRALGGEFVGKSIKNQTEELQTKRALRGKSSKKKFQLSEKIKLKSYRRFLKLCYFANAGACLRRAKHRSKERS